MGSLRCQLFCLCLLLPTFTQWELRLSIDQMLVSYYENDWRGLANHRCNTNRYWGTGSWFNIKITPHQYRKSLLGEKAVAAMGILILVKRCPFILNWSPSLNHADLLPSKCSLSVLLVSSNRLFHVASHRRKTLDIFLLLKLIAMVVIFADTTSFSVMCYVPVNR